MAVYVTLFLFMPTIGFYIMLYSISDNLLLTGAASMGFCWVQLEMFSRAMLYEYFSQYVKVSRQTHGLYLLTRKKD
jgi:hypothetical protein